MMLHVARKCFISFKTEDIAFKRAIQEDVRIDIIDKSLDDPIDSSDEDYVMRRIRDEYLSDSTVTIHLIGSRSAEDFGLEEQRYIKRELQASLYDGANNTRNGILGIILPSMYDEVFKGVFQCPSCQAVHSLVNINDGTTITEFHTNYYIPNNKCHHTEEDRYCVLGLCA